MAVLKKVGKLFSATRNERGEQTYKVAWLLIMVVHIGKGSVFGLLKPLQTLHDLTTHDVWKAIIYVLFKKFNTLLFKCHESNNGRKTLRSQAKSSKHIKLAEK